MISVALSLIPLALAVLGAVVPLVGSDYKAWGLSLAWLVAIAVVALVRAMVRPLPATLVFVDLVLLGLTLVVLFPLGGWWFVPAVAAQTLLDRRAARRAANPEGQGGSARSLANR